MGYPRGYKGYKLLDIATKKMFISTDTQYYENIFLFKSNKPDTVTTDPFHSILVPLVTDSQPTDNIVSPPPSSVARTSHLISLDIPHTNDSPSSPRAIPDIPPQLPTSSTATPAIRKSTRISKPLDHLKDFHCYLLHNPPPTNHPIQSHLSYSQLSKSYKNFVCQISIEYEPHSYSQAACLLQWQNAIQSEL
jgi:hypothetical protein